MMAMNPNFVTLRSIYRHRHVRMLRSALGALLGVGPWLVDGILITCWSWHVTLPTLPPWCFWAGLIAEVMYVMVWGYFAPGKGETGWKFRWRR